MNPVFAYDPLHYAINFMLEGHIERNFET
jgi:hypothetical protein